MSYFNDIKKSHSHSKAMNQVAVIEPASDYPSIIQDGAVQPVAGFEMKETQREEAAKDFEIYVQGDISVKTFNTIGMIYKNHVEVPYVAVVNHRADNTVSPACWIDGWDKAEIGEQAAIDFGIEYAG